MSSVTILYGTHFNGRLNHVDSVERPSRYAGLVDDLRSKATNPLFLGNGDDLAPSVPSTLFYGRQIVDVLNVSGLDYNIYGNHDFDFGPETLREMVEASEFPWLSANVFASSGEVFGQSEGAAMYALQDFGEYTLGITGIADGDTADTSNPGEETEIRPPADAVEEIVPKMRAEGADVVIAISQLMHSEPEAFARRVSCLDVLIGFNHTVEPPKVIDGTVVTCSGDRYESVSELRLDLGSDGIVDYDFRLHELSDVERELEHEAVREVADSYRRRMDEQLNTVVGESAVPLDTRFETIRWTESGICNFVLDAIRETANADVALLPAGCIRTDSFHPAGEITRDLVVEMFPFLNSRIVLTVRGSTLLDALENGVSMVESLDGRFPHVSGMSYEYDPSADPGDRIERAVVGGSSITEGTTYTLATSDFVASGGNGYESFTDAERLSDSDSEPLLSDLVVERIERRGSIEPEADGRIVALDSAEP